MNIVLFGALAVTFDVRTRIDQASFCDTDVPRARSASIAPQQLSPQNLQTKQFTSPVEIVHLTHNRAVLCNTVCPSLVAQRRPIRLSWLALSEYCHVPSARSMYLSDDEVDQSRAFVRRTFDNDALHLSARQSSLQLR